jgi:hypothetical protein
LAVGFKWPIISWLCYATALTLLTTVEVLFWSEFPNPYFYELKKIVKKRPILTSFGQIQAKNWKEKFEIRKLKKKD